MHDSLIAAFVVPEGADAVLTAKGGCDLVNNKSSSVFTFLFLTGFADAMQNDIFFSTYLDVFFACGAPLDATSAAKIHEILTAKRVGLANLAANSETFAAESYVTKSLDDIQSIEPAIMGLLDGEKTAYTTGGFWTPLTNSSTNYNRKRAAYMLRTYFCDDLTPINIAAPDPTAHAGNQHASDPGCQSCHYKLDPMAGFFRYRGLQGQNFEGKPTLVFDDRASVADDKLTSYMDSWRAPAGSNREWNVGYVRSPNPHDAARNAYGSSLDDLAAIIRSAPETKQCLVKRMASYFLGDNQAYDGAWLAGLTAKFNAPAASSSTAFKDVVATLVQSNTFSEPDPSPDQCYDFAADAPASTLPCTVAFVIQNNCATCHAGSGAAGGLDLTSWNALPGGVTTFPHVDSDGNQLSKAESLGRILSRISTNDGALQMPKNKFMAPGDRVTLYQWLNQELTTAAGGH